MRKRRRKRRSRKNATKRLYQCGLCRENDVLDDDTPYRYGKPLCRRCGGKMVEQPFYAVRSEIVPAVKPTAQNDDEKASTEEKTSAAQRLASENKLLEQAEPVINVAVEHGLEWDYRITGGGNNRVLYVMINDGHERVLDWWPSTGTAILNGRKTRYRHANHAASELAKAATGTAAG